MRVAVISDSHGNLYGLRAALEAVDARGPWDAIVMGGDIAFGGPFPAECIALLRERGIPAVRGNTDEAIVVEARGPQPAWEAQDRYWGHSPEAIVSDRWAVERLSDDDIDYLANLPTRIDLGGGDVPLLTLCHATPWSPYPVVRADAPEAEAARMLDEAGGSTLAYGHIHVQYARQVGGRLLVAVGSVGMPFDGSPMADYAEFESTAAGWNARLRQVPYDARPAIKAAYGSGMPNPGNLTSRLAGS